MYTKAFRISRLRLLSSRRKLARLAHLDPTSPLLHALTTLPPQITTLFETAAALPHMDGLGGALQMPVSDPSKRPWETGDVGYTNWAVQQMVMGWKGNGAGIGSGNGEGEEAAGRGDGASATLLSAEERTGKVGSVDEVKALLSDLEENREKEGDKGDEMDTT